MNKEIFLKKCQEIHGDFYDYSKVEIRKSSDKVCISCPLHGEFWMKIGNHLNGKQGCPKCGLNKRSTKRKKTLEQFIFESKQVHGDKYDYSKVEYINIDSHVTIICPQHGEFKQTPYHHLKGNGCPKCNGGIALDKDKFIDKCKKIHNNKYDYSKTQYNGIYQKICIICPKHGEFWQVANNHINGKGCPKCCGKNKDTRDIINEFKEIHGNKYDYSKVVYKGALKKVCIICPEHGEFWQTPHTHLRGCGCQQCGYLRTQKQNQTITRQCANTFIEKARKIHNDKYDYSKVQYANAITQICIICPKHGEFWQTPNRHLQGHGCPKCCESSLEKEIGYILDKNDIFYIKEYKLKNSFKRFDFFIPQFNIFIECQGKQHFEDIPYFSSTPYEQRLESDILKHNFVVEQQQEIIYFTKKEYEKLIPYNNGIYTFDNVYFDSNTILQKIQNNEKSNI